MSWLTANSPLARAQTLNDDWNIANNANSPRTNHSPNNRDRTHLPKVQTTRMAHRRNLKALEQGFVMDAVISSVNASYPGRSVIPPYDAVRDKYASTYFRSPSVQAMLERNDQLRDMKTERNKLSTRRRCKPTPTADDLRRRRDNFVVDAIHVERQRSRYFDIIPPYEATHDNHCKRYFQKDGVKKLLNLTLTPRS